MKPKVMVCLLVLTTIFCFSLSNELQAQGQSFMQSGKWIVSLQLAAGQVRVADTNGILPSVFFPYHENGVDLGVSYGLNNRWAATLSGNIGFSSHKRTVESLPNDYSENVKTSSWGIRGGLDAYFQVADKLVIFAGPGVRYSRSKIKEDVEQPTGGSAGSWDNPWFSSLSFSDRLGGTLILSSNIGLSASFGQQYSYSWLKVNSGGQNQTWKLWSSSFDARTGVTVFFGGK